MSEKKEEKKKKPKIEYTLSENGNTIDASIDEKTHFISFRKPVERKKKGGIGFGLPGFKGEAEKQQKDEWINVVWESGKVMPESVWSDKRRNELLETMKETISTATGVEPLMSDATGTVIPWGLIQMKICPNCGESILSSSKYCSSCGKPQ